MDPFNCLPPELRLMILEGLESRSDIAAAAQASEALGLQTKHGPSCFRIRRLQVENDLRGDLLQAAMAIILFPDPGSSEASISRHLQRWRSNRFANPFQPHPNDFLTIRLLDKLCGCLRLVITDHLSKATSVRLPLAYRTLPKWSHPHFSCGTVQEGLNRYEMNRFNINDLDTDEKYRIYRAFLRYEILSKVYGPLKATRAPAGPRATYRTWDWSLLDDPHPPSVEDLRLLGCIREYYLATHLAVFAELETAALPPPPMFMLAECEPAPALGRLDFMFPPSSTSLFNSPMGGFRYVATDLLASGGLDILMGVLTAPPSIIRNLTRAILHECEYRHRDRFGISIWPLVPLREETDRLRPWCLLGLVRLKRQRAWWLFRDDRFCPGLDRTSMASHFREGVKNDHDAYHTYRALPRIVTFTADCCAPRPHLWDSLNQFPIMEQAWSRCMRSGVGSWEVITG